MKKQDLPTTKQKPTAAQTEKAKKVAKAKEEKQQALVAAIQMYQHDITINSNLANDCLTDEQKECVKALDEGMCPLADMVLTRVTIMATIDEYKKQQDVKNIDELLGKTITNVPYMSTTKQDYEEIIKRRYDMGIGQPVCILVHTSNKLKGVDVDAELGENPRNKQEIILARNQQYFVGKISVGEGCGETYPIIHIYAV